jgi:hypothetical protein
MLTLQLTIDNICPSCVVIIDTGPALYFNIGKTRKLFAYHLTLVPVKVEQQSA